MSEGANWLFMACLTGTGTLLLCIFIICLRFSVRLNFSRAAGLCDLLDYATAVDESVIALKNGALMRIYRFYPQDLSHVEESYAAHLHSLVSRALLKLNGNWAVQVDALREEDAAYLPKVQAVNQTAALLDRLRAQGFAREVSFKTGFYLTLTYLGSSQVKESLGLLMLKQEGREQAGSARQRTLALVENFKERCDSVVETLALTMRLELLQLGKDHEHQALSYIQKCISGREIRLRLPTCPVYLDALLSSSDFESGFTPKVGEQLIAAVAVDGLPSESYFGVLNALAQLPCACRFHTRYLCFDDLQSVFLLEKYRRFWTQKSKGILSQIFNLQGRVNAHALARVEEVDAARTALDARTEIFGSYTAVIILMDKDFDKLQQSAACCVQALENLGFGARIETVNTMEAYLGSLPGHTKENLRRPLVSQRVLADLLPLSCPWEGERSAPSPLIGLEQGPLMQVRTPGRGRFYLNLHEKDLGNTIVIGPPGAGKSVLLQALMVSFLRYHGARIYAFDKGWSFYALSRSLGGEHIVLENVQSALCPLHDLNVGSELSYAEGFVELLCRLSGLELAAAQRLELTQALQLLKEHQPDERTLSDLYLLLSDQELKNALAPYTLLSNPKAILDHGSNLSFKRDLTVFECGSLFDSETRFSLPLLKQLFHLIERSFDGQPVMIVLDEAWQMLRDEAFARELLKWFKTLRKHNVLVVLATQSLTDLANSGLFEIFLECAKTRIFLPNFDAASPVLAPIYQKLGVNEAELARIVHGVPKQDYLFKKGADSVLFELALSGPELYLLSFAGVNCVSAVNELIGKEGSRFFLNAGGVLNEKTA